MATNYKFGYNGNPVDFDDYFVRLDFFATGNLWGWGLNTSGQLGIGSLTHTSSPIQTTAYGHNWKQVASGNQFTHAIKSDGTLWGWGGNLYGQLGDNSNTDRLDPVQNYANTIAWSKVAAGGLTSCGIKVDGTLWSWGGSGGSGVFGNNTTTPSAISSPIQTTGTGNNWKECDVGYGFIIALKTDGTLWGWGDNTYGQLGDNTLDNKSIPTQIGTATTWSQISCGQYHVSAIKTDGTLWCWGVNEFGQLGDETILNKNSPVQTKAVGTNWKKTTCGYRTTAAIKNDGTLWLWGENYSGQLGNNSTQHRSSPVQTNSGGSNWRHVSCGYQHVAAIKTDGSLWTWGKNTKGSLANNSNVSSSVPIEINPTGFYWKEISSGNQHVFAIKYLDSP